MVVARKGVRSSSPHLPAELEFRGWQKTSLIEYPGKVSTVLFTGGCNLRCPFCYNVDLVLSPSESTPIDAESVLRWLSENKTLYQAVIVTGGEPTLAEGLPDFCRRVRLMGLAMGLETNGSDPATLARLLEQCLVDYVALDVKAPLVTRAYQKVTGVTDPGLVWRVRQSVALLGGSGVDYELRTTVVSRFHTRGDIQELASQLAGAPRFVLQRFRAGRCLDPSLVDDENSPSLSELADDVRPFFDRVEVRL